MKFKQCPHCTHFTDDEDEPSAVCDKCNICAPMPAEFVAKEEKKTKNKATPKPYMGCELLGTDACEDCIDSDRCMGIKKLDIKHAIEILQAIIEDKEIESNGRPILHLALSSPSIVINNKMTALRAFDVKKEPKLRPWKSMMEMGEAINHWYRSSPCGRSIFKITSHSPDENAVSVDEVGVNMENMLRRFEHSSTPWDDSSWKECGILE
jgi:hypothetical protein